MWWIKAIGDSAFFCCFALGEINIPNSIEKIGKSAFEGCRASFRIDKEENFNNKLPESLVTIGDRAFAYSNLIYDLVIPDKVTTIGYEAFICNEMLSAVTISPSVKKIGYGAFEYCFNLKVVFINDLESWCNIQFESVFSNPLACGHNIVINGRKIRNLVLPDYIADIPANAFVGANIYSVTLPSFVKNIGEMAFFQNRFIEEIELPYLLEKVEHNAFAFCNKLKNITIKNPETVIEESAFDEYQDTLYVLQNHIEQYKSDPMWCNATIIDNIKKPCEPPVITMKDGILYIESPTPGAICYYSTDTKDVKSGEPITELIINAVAVSEDRDHSTITTVNLFDLINK